jgi:hypothetical protein
MLPLFRWTGGVASTAKDLLVRYVLLYPVPGTVRQKTHQFKRSVLVYLPHQGKINLYPVKQTTSQYKKLSITIDNILLPNTEPAAKPQSGESGQKCHNDNA